MKPPPRAFRRTGAPRRGFRRSRRGARDAPPRVRRAYCGRVAARWNNRGFPADGQSRRRRPEPARPYVGSYEPARRLALDFLSRSNRALSARRRMAAAMAVLESRLDRSSESFGINAQRMERLVAELRERLVAVRAGGGAEAVEKHRRRKKLTARERVERLIDPGSGFLEFSALAAFDMYANGSPAAGMVTGIGIVEGQHCIDRRQRRDGQGRHLLPDDGKETSARARDRGAEPPAVHLSRRFRRRVLAASGRSLSGSRSLRPNLLQSGAHVGQTHRADRRRDGIVHRRRRVRSRDERRDRDRQGPRARSFWADRRW